MLRRTLSGKLHVDRAKTLMELGAMSREQLVASLLPVHEAVPSIALG
jgi:hypothetical protein